MVEGVVSIKGFSAQEMENTWKVLARMARRFAKHTKHDVTVLFCEQILTFPGQEKS